MSYYNEYPEDIINRMSFEEIQNCNWDAFFNRLHDPSASSSQNSTIQNLPESSQYHFGNSQANHGMGDYYPESFGHNYADTSNGHNNYWLYQRDTNYRSCDHEGFNNNCNTFYYISPQHCPHGCTIPVGNHFQNESRIGKRDIVLYRKPIFIPIGAGLKSNRNRVMVLENEDDFYRIVVDDDKLFEVPNISSSSSDDTKSDDATEPPEQLEEDDDVTMQRQQQLMRCKICRRQFRKRRLLLEHLENHQKPFCRVCLSPFKNETNLRTHENKFHPNDDKTLSKRSRTSTAKAEQYGKEAVDKIVVTSKYGRRRKVLDLASVKTTKLTRLTQPPKNHFKKLF